MKRSLKAIVGDECKLPAFTRETWFAGIPENWLCNIDCRLVHDPIIFGKACSEPLQRYDDPEGVFKVLYLAKEA